LLAVHGLVAAETKQAKLVRDPAEVAVPDGLVVGELTSDDRSAFAAVNCAAWGVPPLMATWFGAMIGATVLGQVGGVDGAGTVSVWGRCTSVTAWPGSASVPPSRRTAAGACRQRRSRSAAAAVRGCDLVGTETSSSTTNSSFTTMLKLDFEYVDDTAFSDRRPRTREARQSASWVISTVTPRDSLAPPA
jgi:hypothetical protein